MKTRTTKDKTEIIGKTKLSPYYLSLMVVITKDMEKTLTKMGCEEYKDRSGLAITNEGDCVLVFDQEYISAGVIAHECAHAVFSVMEQIGQGVVKGCEEPFTYLLQYIVNFCHILCEKNNVQLHLTPHN